MSGCGKGAKGALLNISELTFSLQSNSFPTMNDITIISE